MFILERKREGLFHAEEPTITRRNSRWMVLYCESTWTKLANRCRARDNCPLVAACDWFIMTTWWTWNDLIGRCKATRWKLTTSIQLLLKLWENFKINLVWVWIFCKETIKYLYSKYLTMNELCKNTIFIFTVQQTV